jgi:hypothetical protein
MFFLPATNGLAGVFSAWARSLGQNNEKQFWGKGQVMSNQGAGTSGKSGFMQLLSILGSIDQWQEEHE